MLTIFSDLYFQTIPIKKWILNNITFDMYYLDSAASRLLSSLSAFFMFHLLLTEHREIALELAKYYREVQTALSAIPVLILFCSRPSPGESTVTHPKKEGTKKDDGLHATVPPLAELGIPLPTNSSEATRILHQVIERQKYLLSVSKPTVIIARSFSLKFNQRYLDVICMPKIRSEIMAGFIGELNQAHATDSSKASVISRQSDENQISTNVQTHEWKCAAPIL